MKWDMLFHHLLTGSQLKHLRINGVGIGMQLELPSIYGIFCPGLYNSKTITVYIDSGGYYHRSYLIKVLVKISVWLTNVTSTRIYIYDLQPYSSFNSSDRQLL